MISKLLHRKKDKNKHKDDKHKKDKKKNDKHSKLDNKSSNKSKPPPPSKSKKNTAKPPPKPKPSKSKTKNGSVQQPTITNANSNSNSSNSNSNNQPSNYHYQNGITSKNVSKSNHSHDDMSADDMTKRQQRFAKKSAKKRHSHIGAMRHHNSIHTKKQLNVPGNLIEGNENDDNKTSDNVNTKGTGTGAGASMTHGTMGASAATNKRLEQLMKMRAGKDAKGNRSRSVNVSKKKEKEQKYPKKRTTQVHKEPRRHSMFPDKKDGKTKHDLHLKDRRQTVTKKYKKIQYRVKNELFVLYDYYQPVRIIGSGAYAVVCGAINTITGQKCAVKKNKGVFDHITDARRILREIKLLMHFNHQDIISLLDVIPPDHSEIDTFNDVYLIMPKMETTLAKVIRSRQKLTDRHYQFFMYQMLRGLNYMHSANVIHRDLKPENILINGADCNVKITDFGLARGVCKDDNIEKPTEYVVTRWYRSPEVMCSAGFYDEKVDIWSLGCIFAELILRRPLFPGQNYLDQLKIIFEVMGTPKDLKWIKTPEAKRWVKKLKAHNGKPFTAVFPKASDGALQLLSVMLSMDPDNRYSSLECIRHEYLKELHRDDDEVICPPFDLSFEFEKAIKTKFGVRHMMYDALEKFKREHPLQTKTNNNNKPSSSTSTSTASTSTVNKPITNNKPIKKVKKTIITTTNHTSTTTKKLKKNTKNDDNKTNNK